MNGSIKVIKETFHLFQAKRENIFEMQLLQNEKIIDVKV
jgi:hypothetical protein